MSGRRANRAPTCPSKRGLYASLTRTTSPRTAWAVGGVVLAVAALVGVIVTAAVCGGGGGEPAGRAGAAVRTDGGGGADADPTARSVNSLQARLRRVPGDWTAWATLGTTYVERARLTGDPTYYPRAEAALTRSLVVRPIGNDGALAGQAALAAARHDFPGALRLADAAIAVNPYNAAAHGIRSDALTELGRYPEAWQAVQRMVDLRPDVASLSRVSYAFELRGQTEPARSALHRVVADATSPADAAFAWYHLGELARNDGDLAGADDAYGRGLARDPGYPPLLVGRARVAAARGRTAAALADYRTAVTRLPLPAVVIEYGELLESLGRVDEARTQYALARSTAGLFRSQGVDVDVELALFEADHGDPATALRAVSAPSGQHRRAGVFVDDARGWALHRLGRDTEALAPARAAVALGTHRALFRYHLGVIEAALGQRPAAQADLRAALAMDPNFSPLLVPAARALLASLDGTR
jgi:tetratricopeptide (TPR) repeat protein